MESSKELARRFGLERYLYEPDALNEMIFKLMMLQETIQMEAAQKVKLHAKNVIVKRSVHGKYVAHCRGDGKYRYAVETALRASTTVIPVFQRSRFVRMLCDMGLSDGIRAEYCDTLVIDDDTHCFDPE
ncbi:MAG TPA: hypothetical protein VK654_16940 [Nitrospirota bacterium]|nr:hypothetical protein [Nitrospirota bacterium]